jgi:hypothetical protein
MELKIIILITLVISVISIAVRARLVWLEAGRTQQTIKLVDDSEIDVKATSIDKHNSLLEKSALLLIQSEILDLEHKEVSEEELFKIAMSFRMDRRSKIKQLKNTKILDMELAKKRLIDL